MNALAQNQYSQAWIEFVNLIQKPKAILVISAHWETEGVKITSNKMQKTIHDFYGFPSELFGVQYNPKGDENLVKRVCELVSEAQPDSSWGLDHGAWSVLKHIYPQANIPVIQLSLDHKKTPQQHYEIAQKLLPLREEGVLIIASGNIVHNLRMLKWDNDQQPYSWAIEFNSAIKNAILNGEHEAIKNYQKFEGAKESVPTPEHFIPLIYILALKKKMRKLKFLPKDSRWLR